MGQLLLVRHGQASFGADDYDVLSPTGWEQGRRLGAHLAAAGVSPTALVRGTMRRHRETLEAMCEGAGGATPDKRGINPNQISGPKACLTFFSRPLSLLAGRL